MNVNPTTPYAHNRTPLSHYDEVGPFAILGLCFYLFISYGSSSVEYLELGMLE